MTLDERRAALADWILHECNAEEVEQIESIRHQALSKDQVNNLRTVAEASEADINVGKIMPWDALKGALNL